VITDGAWIGNWIFWGTANYCVVSIIHEIYSVLSLHQPLLGNGFNTIDCSASVFNGFYPRWMRAYPRLTHAGSVQLPCSMASDLASWWLFLVSFTVFMSHSGSQLTVPPCCVWPPPIIIDYKNYNFRPKIWNTWLRSLFKERRKCRKWWEETKDPSCKTSQCQIYVMTNGQSWCQASVWGPTPDFCYCQLRVCWCGVPSLTRGRVCCLQLLLDLASAVILGSVSCETHDHILMSQIWEFPNLEGQVPVFMSLHGYNAVLSAKSQYRRR
jgi:hypothetical protein